MQIYKWIPLKAEEEPTNCPDMIQPIAEPADLELPPTKRIKFNDENRLMPTRINGANDIVEDEPMMTDQDDEVRHYDELKQVNRNSIPFNSSNVALIQQSDVRHTDGSLDEDHHQSQTASNNITNITSVSQTLKQSADDSLSMSLMDVSTTNLDGFQGGDQHINSDECSMVARLITSQLVDNVTLEN